MKRLSKYFYIFLILIFLLLVLMFFFVRQYWIAFLTLVLVVVINRIDDLKYFVLGSKGISAEFEEKEMDLTKVIRSKNPQIKK